MKRNKSLDNLVLVCYFIGFILFLFVGIVFWAIHFKDNLFNLPFLFAYSLLVIYSFLNLVVAIKESNSFKVEEEENLLKIKMNHSLVFSLFFIGISLPLLSIKYLESDLWSIFLVGLVLFAVFSFWLVFGYFFRYRKLKKIYEKEIMKI